MGTISGHQSLNPSTLKVGISNIHGETHPISRLVFAQTNNSLRS